MKNNAVTAAKIKNNAITGGKIANGAVTASKLGGAAVGASNLGANSVGPTALSDNAVTGSKIANGAVSGDKIANDAVGGEKIANGAVTSTKIGAGAVGSTQLAEAERSEAFKAEGSGLLNLELAQPVSQAPTVIQSLALPLGGQYVVTGETELILSTGTSQFSQCFLADEGASIATAADTYEKGLLSVSGGVSMTGVSNGGTITLACRSSGAGTFAFNRQIVAIRVGSVN
ncbi:MAG: hypothetical protein BGO11_01835 [Solirubrobacterales bacterium 70-9]|nr:MAG: hypothetical protein BGO11_01835 [Solirubrobacterales bacterium 70-9]